MTTPSAVAIVEEEVRDRLRRRGVDAASEARVEMLIDEVLDEYEQRLDAGDVPVMGERSALRRTVMDRVAGLGVLQPLLDDPDVEEIWINGPGRVFCARNGTHVLTNIAVAEDEIRLLVERMLRASGRRLDLSRPFVDATLADGSRLHVAIPDITRKHWAVNVRKFVLKAHRLDELARLGTLSPACAAFLEASVKAGQNIVVAGGTQAGKTTMLNCLAACIPPLERVITCEEVFELQISLPDVVSMQTRAASIEGTGAIDLRRLIVEALRMRPDRIIVGEVRQHEALDLLVALNSGLPGMTSIHANSAREAITKLSTLPLLAGGNVTHAFIVPTVATSIDLIVHLANDRGRRTVSEVIGVTGRTEGGVIETVRLWERKSSELLATGHPAPHRQRYPDATAEAQWV